MKKLIAGVRDFHVAMRNGGEVEYQHLASVQQPDTLFIACSDSRVVPAFISNANPGALFTVRNVGNMIPPVDGGGASIGDHSEASAIEYAVAKLDITDIVVCGHSGCGAMAALLGEPEALPVNLAHWIGLAKPALDAALFPATLGGGLDRTDTLSQRNVLLQMRALGTYPDVRTGLEKGKLRIHGWWFDIRRVCVDAFDEGSGTFRPFDAVYDGGA